MGLDLSKYPKIAEATVFAEGVIWGQARLREQPDVAWFWSQIGQAACCEHGKDWMLTAEFRAAQIRDIQRALARPDVAWFWSQVCQAVLESIHAERLVRWDCTLDDISWFWSQVAQAMLTAQLQYRAVDWKVP